jgi:hypothetical protein
MEDKVKIGLVAIIPEGISEEGRAAMADVLKAINNMYDIKDYDEVTDLKEFEFRNTNWANADEAREADELLQSGAIGIEEWDRLMYHRDELS